VLITTHPVLASQLGRNITSYAPKKPGFGRRLSSCRRKRYKIKAVAQKCTYHNEVKNNGSSQRNGPYITVIYDVIVFLCSATAVTFISKTFNFKGLACSPGNSLVVGTGYCCPLPGEASS
jgi:hypothetical protein